jgi:hypothetical protein
MYYLSLSFKLLYFIKKISAFIEILLTTILYPINGEEILKGRTTCPKCNNEFILDIPKNKEKYSTICPNCNHKFSIKKSIECKDLEDECVWEEHGEPRKTILSSIKPRTDKPMIASVLLFIVFLIVLSSAISIQIFPNLFFDSNINYFFNIKFINNNQIIFFSIFIILSLIALIGSISSYKRYRLSIVILCSLICIFSIGFFFIGSILSIISLIIIINSRDEFKYEKKEKTF